MQNIIVKLYWINSHFLLSLDIICEMDALSFWRWWRFYLLIIFLFFLVFRILSIFLNKHSISQPANHGYKNLYKYPRKSDDGSNEEDKGHNQSGKIIGLQLVRREYFGR